MADVMFIRDEADLISAARGGDGAAFAELIRPQYRSAFRVAYGLLHNVAEAEDAVQEAAFKAWRRLGNLRDGSSLRPWFLFHRGQPVPNGKRKQVVVGDQR